MLTVRAPTCANVALTWGRIPTEPVRGASSLAPSLALCKVKSEDSAALAAAAIGRIFDANWMAI